MRGAPRPGTRQGLATRVQSCLERPGAGKRAHIAVGGAGVQPLASRSRASGYSFGDASRPEYIIFLHAYMESILSLAIHPALGARWTTGKRESDGSIGMHWFWWPAIQLQQSAAAHFGRSPMPYEERD